MVEVLPLPEGDRHGYLAIFANRAFAVDVPLDTDAVTEFIPGWVELAAVVETGIPGHRVAGGRLLAEATDAPLHGPGRSIRGARGLGERSRIADFPGVVALAAPGYGESDIVVLAEDRLFVGDLDGGGRATDRAAAQRVVRTRAELASRFPDHVVYGSAGEMRGAGLAELAQPPECSEPLNFEAINLTNRGTADMFWADPRVGGETSELDPGYLRDRLDSPWAPVVVDMRSGGEDVEGARRIPPGRLASEIGQLATGREAVVLADDAEVAAAAAGFLARLGIRAAWVRS